MFVFKCFCSDRKLPNFISYDNSNISIQILQYAMLLFKYANQMGPSRLNPIEKI